METGNLIIRFKTRKAAFPVFIDFQTHATTSSTKQLHDFESIVERMAADSMSRVIRFSTSSLLSVYYYSWHQVDESVELHQTAIH